LVESNRTILQPANKPVFRMNYTALAMDYGRNDTSAKDKEDQDGWFARKEVNKDLRQPLVNPPGYSDKWKDDYDHFHDPLRTRRPKWESKSVFFSTVAFLLYWGLLREENDWDHALYELEEQYRRTQNTCHWYPEITFPTLLKINSSVFEPFKNVDFISEVGQICFI